MVHVWLGTVSVSICQIIVSICQNTDRMSQNSRPAYATAQLAYVPTQPAYATTQLQKDRSVSIKQNTPSMCQNTATVNENMASHIPEHRGWETGTPIPPFTPLLLRKIFQTTTTSHQKSYFGSERRRLSLPELSARWWQSRSCDQPRVLLLSWRNFSNIFQKIW